MLALQQEADSDDVGQLQCASACGVVHIMWVAHVRRVGGGVAKVVSEQ